MKSKDMDAISEMTNSILSFNSRNQLYVKEDISKKLKDAKEESEKEKIIKNASSKYLQTFAKETKINRNIIHFGITFALSSTQKTPNKKPYIFFHYIYPAVKAKLNRWLKKYENLSDEAVILPMNHLLCEKEKCKEKSCEKEHKSKYWKHDDFPKIIAYKKDKPYHIKKDNNIFVAKELSESYSSQIFKKGKLPKSKLLFLHNIFKEEESYSPFKVFFTSNFRGMHSQTFIKFREVICNIDDEKELQKFIEFCFLLDSTIGSVIYDFERIIYHHEYYDEILKHGTKSAVLSIDVRNLSHNIGSHVLAYWIQELNQLLQDFSSDNAKLQTAIYKSKALFRYIQHRADFLAEVATSIPCSEMTFNLKKDILNPFLKDDNSNGNPYNINNDNTKGGLPLDSNVYVLLRYIADSEGITINFDESSKVKKMITYNVNNQSESIWVSIPSGIIGKHAIYSILENFIRNAAKHYKGKEKNGKNFIKINVEKHNEDYIKVEITDIREVSCKPKYVNDLKGCIEGGFVDEQGSLKSGGWGIKEMLISANFLRKNTPEDLYDIITKRKTCNPLLLEIICQNNANKTERAANTSCKTCNYNKNLGIRFYLKKPKHLAVMVDSIKDEQIKKDVFEIKKITAHEFKDKPIPHNILLVDGKTFKDKYKDKDDPLAPCRVMVYDGTDELKDCMGVYNKNKPNDGMITGNYYLCLYEKFIEKEISAFNNMKIVNDLDLEYKFKETNYSLLTYKKNATETNAKDNVVFKDHPEKDTSDTDFTSSKYFQPMSGGFSTKAKFHLNKDLPELIRAHFYLELIESALTKVVIVDERISEWANQKSKYRFAENGEYKTQREMLKKMNVYVAEIEKENISKLNEKLKKCTLGCSVLNSENGATNKNTAHFFVIHQGILEKLEDKKFMNKIKCRWKVIDSGRGVPEEIKHRFVQISALQTLLENYDKHGLVQTLFSLRKPVKEGKSGN